MITLFFILLILGLILVIVGIFYEDFMVAAIGCLIGVMILIPGIIIEDTKEQKEIIEAEYVSTID